MEVSKLRRILGYILGFIIGWIFSLPWILLYVYFEKFFSYLSILIVLGLILGYKIICKKFYNTKSNKAFLIIASILIVIIDVFGIMFATPFLIDEITFEQIKVLYSTKIYLLGLTFNCVLAILLNAIPAILLPIDFNKDDHTKSESEEFLDKVEKCFKKYNAFSKETAVDKHEIKKELNKIEMNSFKRFWFIDSLSNFRIKSKKGKWYFVKKEKKFKIGILCSICILFLITFSWNTFYKPFSKKLNESFINEIKEEIREQTKNIEVNIDDNLTITLPETLKLESSDVTINNDVVINYYEYLSQNLASSPIQVVAIYKYNDYLITDYARYKSMMHDTNEKYKITSERDIEVDGNKGFVYTLEELDEERITNAYIISCDDKILEIYIYLTKEEYNSETEELSDNTIKSLKIK